MGVEVRRAFDLRYRYVRLWHQRYDLAVRMRPDVREARTDTLLSVPDSVLPRLERDRAERRATGYGVRGTIWLDPESSLIERLDVEHLSGERPISDIRFTYGDVIVDGSPLRLPLAGTGWFRPASAPQVARVTIALTFAYDGFAEAPLR